MPLAGALVIRHVVRNTLRCRVQQVVVVLGAEAPAVRAALSNLPVTAVTNAAYAQGMSTTLRVGLAHAPQRSSGGRSSRRPYGLN